MGHPAWMRKAARVQADDFWQKRKRKGSIYPSPNFLLREVKPYGVLKLGTWTKWVRARRAKDNKGRGNFPTNTVPVKLKVRMRATKNDILARRGPWPAGMKKKPGKKVKIGGEVLRVLRADVASNPTRRQADRAASLEQSPAYKRRVAAHPGMNPKISQPDVSKAMTLGRNRRGRKKQRHEDDDDGDIKLGNNGSGQGRVSIKSNKSIRKHAHNWNMDEREFDEDVMELRNPDREMSLDETPANRQELNMKKGAAAVGRDPVVVTYEGDKWNASIYAACWNEHQCTACTVNGVAHPSRIIPAGGMWRFDPNIRKCAFHSRGEACATTLSGRRKQTCRTKRAKLSCVRESEVTPMTYVGKDEDRPVYCGGGGTKKGFLRQLELSMQQFKGISGRPDTPISVVGGDTPTIADMKQRDFIRLDKSGNHVRHSEPRDLASERLVWLSAKWRDYGAVNGDDLSDRFHGQPNDDVLKLCKLYGFDCMVIPTRSFDRDRLDRGMFSNMKQWMRYEVAGGRRPRTAQGLIKLWDECFRHHFTAKMILHHQWLPGTTKRC